MKKIPENQIIKTDRCILTKPQQQDYKDIEILYLNAEVRRYLGGPVDSVEFNNRILPKINSDNNSLYWVIRQASDNEFIGLISLDLHHDGIDTEVSYQLLPRWWDQGYATEITQRVIKYAFENLGLMRLIAETQKANTASCRLLEKVGMKQEQTIERFDEEQVIYSITNLDIYP